MHLQSYIQQTRTMQSSAWVLQRNQNNRGEVLIHIESSSFRRVDTAAEQATPLSPKVQKVVQKKESESIHRFSKYRKTVSNIRQSHLMTKPRTNACSLVFFHNIELAYEGGQITKSEPRVGCVCYVIHQRDRDQRCVKEHIEMPARFHSRFCVSKQRCIKPSIPQLWRRRSQILDGAKVTQYLQKQGRQEKWVEMDKWYKKWTSGLFVSTSCGCCQAESVSSEPNMR